jgi:hypothetical protein
MTTNRKEKLHFTLKDVNQFKKWIPSEYEEMKDKYGDEIAHWLGRLLYYYILLVDDGCIDNTRFAETTNEEEMRNYNEQQKEGCCGFFDKEVTHKKTGRKFMIGFNFGH